MPKLKVLQINLAGGLGSTGRIVNQLATACIEAGHFSYLAYGRRCSGFPGDTYRIGGVIDQGIHLVGTRLLDRHGFLSTKATRNLVNYMRLVEPDVIHLHNLHGYYLNIEVLFEFLRDFSGRVVWTLHDCWPFTGHCAYYARTGCERWKTECHDCPLSGYYPSAWVTDNSRGNFHRKRQAFTGLRDLQLVAVSDWLKQQVASSFLKEQQISRIWNPVDLSIFRPHDVAESRSALGLPKEKKLILAVANMWSTNKGLRVLEGMVERLPSEWKMICIGAGLPESRLRAKGVIIVRRTQSPEQLSRYYSAADVFVSPSIAESFGLVVAEALACGTPCVVRSGSAMTELVNSEVGAVVSGNSPLDYVSACERVLRLADDQENRKACRSRACCMFSAESRLADYLGLYEDHSVSACREGQGLWH